MFFKFQPFKAPLLHRQMVKGAATVRVAYDSLSIALSTVEVSNHGVVLRQDQCAVWMGRGVKIRH